MQPEVPGIEKEHPAVREMTESCRDLLERLRKLTEGHVKQDILLRHDIGRLVADSLQDEAGYGSNVMGQLEEALGWRQGFLYECQRMANQWTRESIEAIVARTDKYGNRITWSHFVVLSGLHRHEIRERLLELKFARGLSVRALEAEVRRAQGRTRGTRIKPRSAWAGLSAMKRKVEEVMELEEQWETDIYQRLENPLELRDKKVLEGLEAAQEAHTRLKEFAEGNLAKIAVCVRDLHEACEELGRDNPLLPPPQNERQRRIESARERGKAPVEA